MASLFKNQILKHLSRFAKNLSANMIQLSALKGFGELHNLELNELVLTEVLELPSWLRITYAYCNHITIKIHWTKLKTHPIHLTLDDLIVETETCEDLRPLNEHANSSIYSGSQGKYGFSDRVIDGMLIHISSVNINFNSPHFQASLMLSRLTVESRTPSWKQGELRLCRIKDTERGEILLFKQVDWQVVRIEAKARTPDSNLTPLRLITNQACCRLTIKKRLKDCSLVDWKVMVVLDDLLWVLTDSQLLAAVHFSSTLSELIRRSTEQAHKVKAKHKLEQQNEARQQNKPVPPTQQHKAQGSVPLSSISRFFNHYNIHETSYHILCHRIDLHLCDELNPTEGRSGYEGLQKGGAFLLSLRKFEVDYYPYHQAFSSRDHWVRYTEPSSGRAAWVQQLVTSFHDQQVGGPRKTPHSPTLFCQESPSNPEEEVQSSRRTSLLQKRLKYLMSSCIVIRLDEYQAFKVSTAQSCRKGPAGAKQDRFLSSDLHSISLPPETKALHLELTSYYYPGEMSCPAPPPNLYAYLGPLVLTYDITTILWLNTFFMNLQNSLTQLLSKVPQNTTASRPLLVKVEALMLQLEYHADTTNPSHPDRPKAMKLQSSRMVATNCRLGDHATRSHLSQCLETLSQSSLIYHTNLFPWEPQDFQPISDTFISHSLEAENQVFGDGIWNIHFDPVWVEFLGCEPGRHRPQTFVEPLPVTVWLSWAQPAPEKCSELSVLVHFHSMLNVQLTHHQYLFLLRFMDAYSLLSAHITLDTKAILKETQPLTIGLTTWLSQVEVSLILRSLNQLSATSDSMEPLSLQEDCSSNENLKTTKNLVMQNSFSSHETDNFPPTSPPLSSPQQPANGISPQHSDSSFNSLLPSDKSAVPTPQSAETPPQPTPPPPRPASDSLQRGFHSATSAMKKGLYQIMPSMEAILPPTNDTTAPHDNDDATSLRSDLSSDSDQFVIQGLETSLVGGDDDIFRSSSPAEVELASEVKEDTFSNATTNLSERKRELISTLVVSLSQVEVVVQSRTDGAYMMAQCHRISTVEQPSISWDNFQSSFSSRSRGRQTPVPGSQSSPQGCLQYRLHMPPVKNADPPPPSPFLQLRCQNVPLTLLKSSLTALSDFLEDEVSYPITPFHVLIRNLTLTVVEEKSVLTSVPMKLVLPSCCLERSEDGTIKLVPGGEEKPAEVPAEVDTEESLKKQVEQLRKENEHLRKEVQFLHRLRPAEREPAVSCSGGNLWEPSPAPSPPPDTT